MILACFRWSKLLKEMNSWLLFLGRVSFELLLLGNNQQIEHKKNLSLKLTQNGFTVINLKPQRKMFVFLLMVLLLIMQRQLELCTIIKLTLKDISLDIEMISQQQRFILTRNGLPLVNLVQFLIYAFGIHKQWKKLYKSNQNFEKEFRV